MGPKPRIKPKNISLYESLGIAFFQALFLLGTGLNLKTNANSTGFSRTLAKLALI